MSDNSQTTHPSLNSAADAGWPHFRGQDLMDILRSAGPHVAPYQPLRLTGEERRDSEVGFFQAPRTQSSTAPSHSPMFANSPGGFTHVDSGYGESRPTFSATTPSVTGTNRRKTSPIKPPCVLCGYQAKNNSEMKKHQNQHDKPNKCDIVGCGKGFATQNDLKRHQRSVHRAEYHDAKDTVCFKCTHCDQDPTSRSNRRKRENWPRKDNFLAHLDRVHKIKISRPEEMQRYIVHPETTEPSTSLPPNISAPMPRNEVVDVDLRGVGMGQADSSGFLGPSQYPRDIEQPGGSNSDLWAQERVTTFQQRYGERPHMQAQEHINPQQLTNDIPQLHVSGGLELVGLQSPHFGGLEAFSDRLSGEMDDVSSSNTIFSGSAAFLSSQNLMPLHHGQHHVDNCFTGLMNEAVMTDAEQDNADSNKTTLDNPKTDWEMTATESQTVGTSLLDDADEDEDDEEEEEEEEEGGEEEEEEEEEEDNDDDEATPTEWSTTSNDLLTGFLNSAPGAGSHHQEPDLVDALARLPNHLLEKALEIQAGRSTVASNSASGIKCPKCPKTFKRQCDLTKHCNRHKRLYRCTDRDCNKVFGSKNDWKRHESTQHYNTRAWQCAYNGCDRTYSRKEAFRSHLQRDHGINDARVIEHEIATRQIGRFNDKTFWCGFCVASVEVGPKEGGNAWDQRCNHIDDHIAGRNGAPKMASDKWQHQEAQGDNALRLSEKAFGKRPIGDDGGTSAPSKRRSPSWSQMWRCCRCNHDMNVRTSPSCIECHHPRCDENCITEASNIMEY